MKKYILALDQGTTSSRAILFDEAMEPVSSAQYPFTQYFPKPGYVEHDPEEILDSQFRAMRDAVSNAGVMPSEIAAIGIANQRETALAWDKATGKPLCNAIVWQCRRTSDICEQLKNDGKAELIKSITGLPVDPYFSGTKYKWILENIPKAANLAAEGRLAFGTVDSWLIWNLTDGGLHITDVTNASRSMLFDIGKLRYDEELCNLLGVPLDSLPKVMPSGGLYGHISTKKYLLGEFDGIPICSAIGDQQASLFGQRCFSVGDTKNTYGTGCFTLMNVGTASDIRAEGIITTVGWQYGGKTVWALEGSVFNAGSSIQWLRDQLGIISTAAECDTLAESISTNGGVYLVSAFSGLGTPYWDMYARGGIFGLTRGTTKAHIARATLEGIAYQVFDLVKTMESASSRKVGTLMADGGASVSRFLMQFQADLLGTDVICPPYSEITALGAAMLAGLVSGVLREDDLTDIGSGRHKKYSPSIGEEERSRLISEWHSAVERVMSKNGKF